MSVLAVIAVIFSYIIKGMCGFANTLVFSTIMSFTTNNINISPVDLILCYPSNVFITWKERKYISAKICVPLMLMVIAGSVPGILLLKNGDVRFIKSLFGFVVAFMGIEMLIEERQKEQKKASKLFLIIIGIISGILSGLFGIGALLAIYISKTTKNQNQFRGNISIVFLAESSLRIILYSIMGILNKTILRQALSLMPFMVIGLVIGIFLSKKICERIVKKAVIIVLILSGAAMVINNMGLFMK